VPVPRLYARCPQVPRLPHSPLNLGFPDGAYRPRRTGYRTAGPALRCAAQKCATLTLGIQPRPPAVTDKPARRAGDPKAHHGPSIQLQLYLRPGLIIQRLDRSKNGLSDRNIPRHRKANDLACPRRWILLQAPQEGAAHMIDQIIANCVAINSRAAAVTAQGLARTFSPERRGTRSSSSTGQTGPSSGHISPPTSASLRSPLE